MLALHSHKRRLQAQIALYRKAQETLPVRAGKENAAAPPAYGFVPLLSATAMQPCALKQMPTDPKELLKAYKPKAAARQRQDRTEPKTPRGPKASKAPKAAARARGEAHGSPKSVIESASTLAAATLAEIGGERLYCYDEYDAAMPPPSRGGFDFACDALTHDVFVEDYSEDALFLALAEAFF